MASLRLPLILLGALAGASFVCVALAIPATAQTDDGCTQGNPCPLTLNVDSTGFLESGLDGTAGDWFTLTVQNNDGAAHTVRIQALAVTVNAAPDSEASSAAFQASSAGAFAVTDSPSGDEITFDVLTEDVVEASRVAASNRATGGKETPGLEVALALAGLAAAAVVSRRA